MSSMELARTIGLTFRELSPSTCYINRWNSKRFPTNENEYDQRNRSGWACYLGYYLMNYCLLHEFQRVTGGGVDDELTMIFILIGIESIAV